MLEEYEERPRVSKRKSLGIFGLLLTLSLIASTLASSIKINGLNRIEFGQGVYNLKACDSFVNLSFDGNGAGYMQHMYMSGFDKTKCKNKYFTIKVQKNGNNLDLFSFQSLTVSDCSVTNKVNATVSVYNNSCVVKFTATGSATLPSGVSTIDYLLVGGGGSGGGNRGGGGGAGAYVTQNNISISSRDISAVVGSGGAAITTNGNATPIGNNGSFSSIDINGGSNTSGGSTYSAKGGGGGGSHVNKGEANVAPEWGVTGGSGGGGSMNYSTIVPQGGGKTNSPYSATGYFGNNGGTSTSSADANRYTGGGGGAGGAGDGGGSSQKPNGGIGKLDFLGNYVAAGGGGADGRGATGSSPYCETNYSSSGAGDGGSGVGGRGELSCNNVSGQAARSATSGESNTGSGGGAAVSGTSGAGGTGLVEVRFTPTSWTTSNRIVLHVSNDATPVVSLVYTYGSNAGSDIPSGGDDYQVITYSSGVYTVEFLQPIVLVADVTSTTFESADTYT